MARWRHFSSVLIPYNTQNLAAWVLLGQEGEERWVGCKKEGREIIPALLERLCYLQVFNYLSMSHSEVTQIVGIGHQLIESLISEFVV